MNRPTVHAPLDTPRLILEPLVAEHAPMVFASLLDERLYRFIPQDPPQSVEALRALYGRLSARRSPDGAEAWLNWAMRLRESGRYVGTLQATVSPEPTAHVAYFVFVPFQRRGYAQEGVARIVEHLVGDYAVETVVAEVDTRNAASIALLERLGFARVATKPEADYFKGERSDEYRYELRRRGGGEAP